MIDALAILQIQQLIHLYGHIADERQWSRIPELFTEDAIFDMTDFGMPMAHGIVEIDALWRRPDQPHPLAHHATNIVITEAAGGTVRVVSKGIGVGVRGKVGSVTYYDVVRLTPQGWRIAHRVATLRRPEKIPAPS